MEDKYKEFIKNKQSFEDFKTENYRKFFVKKLTDFLMKNDYSYNSFQLMISDKFDHDYSTEGLLDLLTIKDELGNHIENYIDVVGHKLAGIFYLFLNEIPQLHSNTIESLINSYQVYELELDQEFKWKNKLKDVD